MEVEGLGEFSSLRCDLVPGKGGAGRGWIVGETVSLVLVFLRDLSYTLRQVFEL